MEREPQGESLETLLGSRINLKYRVYAEPEQSFFSALGLSGQDKLLGISVSFPLLTERHWDPWNAPDVIFRSPIAEIDYSPPAARIHIPGQLEEYLLVQEDRVVRREEMEEGLEFNLLIMPRKLGEFPVKVRAWMCGGGDTECSMMAATGSPQGQQGWFEEELIFNVTADYGLVATSEGDWKQNKIYLRGVRKGEEITLGSRIQLTYDYYDDINPSISPDGKRIAFQSDRDDPNVNDDHRVWNIYSMNIDGAEVTRLTTEGGINVEPSWSPDGERIAFATKEGLGWSLYSMNSDGSDVARVSREGVDARDPTWAPDGRRIAFESNPQDEKPPVICVTTLVDDDWSKGNCERSGRSPSWSPDGDRIAFVAGLSSGSGIFLMNPSGSRSYELAGGRGFWRYDPSWSPDGQYVIYVRSHAGTSVATDKIDLYVASKTGSYHKELGTDDRNPDWWSPIFLSRLEELRGGATDQEQ